MPKLTVLVATTSANTPGWTSTSPMTGAWAQDWESKTKSLMLNSFVAGLNTTEAEGGITAGSEPTSTGASSSRRKPLLLSPVTLV